MRHAIRFPGILRVVLAVALIGVLLLSGSAAVSADTIMLYERFDDVTPPALPGGWASTSVVGSGCVWATQNGTINPAGYDAYSAPNVVYMNAASCTAGYSARLYRTSGLNLTSVTTASVSFYMFRDVFKPDNNDLVQNVPRRLQTG